MTVPVGHVKVAPPSAPVWVPVIWPISVDVDIVFIVAPVTDATVEHPITGELQTPAVQVAPPTQTFPQLPQLFASVWKFAHPPSHAV